MVVRRHARSTTKGKRRAEHQGDGRVGAVHDRGFWKERYDEGGLAWDDSNNNRAFLSGTICATLNGASIYIESLRKPDQYKTEKGAQMKDDILHAPLPKGRPASSPCTPFHCM